MKNAVASRSPAPADSENVEASQSGADVSLFPRETPKNYLMAWLLVMLKDLNRHGYEIMKALKENVVVVSEPATVYRALRQLERDGYVTSWWDARKQGPARRIYTLTETGNDVLKIWSAALEQHRTSLDAFFSLYTGT
jgi:PadR family transcriptional regulator PadR